MKPRKDRGRKAANVDNHPPDSVTNERDFLSVIIHDLIHADHFLKDNKNMLGQLGFYHFIGIIWLHDSLQTLLLSS